MSTIPSVRWSGTPNYLKRGVSRLFSEGRHLTTFEKVLVANSAIIILDTVAGWWITQHNPEPYHYLIDTLFIALATLTALAVNFALLKAAFAPLHAVMATIRAVEGGDLTARAEARESDTDASVLARAFNQMLDHLSSVRDETTSHVLLAQEMERRRLALELHDQTAQTLTALSLHAQAIADGLAHESSGPALRARQHAERVSGLAQGALGEVQSVARQLRPSILDDLGLLAALRWLAEDAAARLGAEVSFETDVGDYSHELRFPEDVETALFRIAQESVTNAVRHGEAQHIHVTLCRSTGALDLAIRDDGSGFSPLALDHAGEGAGMLGLGVEGMRERARLLGGSFVISEASGGGCLVRAVIPCQAHEVAVSS